MSGIKNRIMVAVLSLSATALVGLALDESYTSAAVIPTRGDVPTLGFGSTTHADGRAVRMGDTTTPAKALARTLQYIQADEADMRNSLDGVALHQAEYDIYIDWRYQYGATAWRGSSMLRELRAGNYPGACQALLRYRFSAGYDCSTPGNRVCAGVWARQQARHAVCMASQS
jgi:lysozyme